MDSGLVAQARQLGVFGYRIDPQFVGKCVEIGVARMHDRGVKVERSMMCQTGEETAVEARSAGTGDPEIRADLAGFETRESHDRLECRARRPLLLDGAVEQRMVGIIDQVFPVALRDTGREL